ncbi:MAG: rhodanese-like domain-containing protein [Pseudooceanicola sp.]|nr:rhodanese-like domain-containing protein [Pseudooceanicola sp.]
MFHFLNRKPAGLKGLTAADVVAAGAAGEITLLDIRELAEIQATGLAKGAVHAPLMTLQFRADPRHPDYDKRLKPEAKIAVYCASGARSVGAIRILKSLGYGDVHNIGGLGQWLRAGGELTKG